MNGNKLLEYCETRIKCEWILAKDFIYLGHYALNGILVKLIAEYKEIFLMSTMPEGIVFYFNGKGFVSNRARLQRKIDNALKEDSNYVIGRGIDRMTTIQSDLREVNLQNQKESLTT